jgi:hypothetical protein
VDVSEGIRFELIVSNAHVVYTSHRERDRELTGVTRSHVATNAIFWNVVLSLPDEVANAAISVIAGGPQLVFDADYSFSTNASLIDGCLTLRGLAPLKSTSLYYKQVAASYGVSASSEACSLFVNDAGRVDIVTPSIVIVNASERVSSLQLEHTSNVRLSDGKGLTNVDVRSRRLVVQHAIGAYSINISDTSRVVGDVVVQGALDLMSLLTVSCLKPDKPIHWRFTGVGSLPLKTTPSLAWTGAHCIGAVLPGAMGGGVPPQVRFNGSGSVEMHLAQGGVHHSSRARLVELHQHYARSWLGQTPYLNIEWNTHIHATIHAALHDPTTTVVSHKRESVSETLPHVTLGKEVSTV